MGMEIGEVSTERLNCLFAHTGIPEADRRSALEQAVLKRLVGYVSGSKLEGIMMELGFITVTGNVSTKGKWFLYSSFCEKRGVLPKPEETEGVTITRKEALEVARQTLWHLERERQESEEPQNCAMCCYWGMLAKIGEVGECRKSHPSPTPDGKGRMWPVTYRYDCCFEFERKTEV